MQGYVRSFIHIGGEEKIFAEGRGRKDARQNAKQTMFGFSSIHSPATILGTPAQVLRDANS